MDLCEPNYREGRIQEKILKILIAKLPIQLKGAILHNTLTGINIDLTKEIINPSQQWVTAIVITYDM